MWLATVLPRFKVFAGKVRGTRFLRTRVMQFSDIDRQALCDLISRGAFLVFADNVFDQLHNSVLPRLALELAQSQGAV